MNITISMSTNEAKELAKDLNIDSVELLKLLSKFNTQELMVNNSETSSKYSLEAVWEWFEKISWQTLYFSHLIIIYANKHNQIDDYGLYLNAEQLSKLGISERSAASRVGGSRRVCKKINLIDILFIKIKSKQKLFYLDNNSVDFILQILKEVDSDYKRELSKINIEYPDEI